jgi:uncharacterized protein (TIGR02270 family)
VFAAAVLAFESGGKDCINSVIEAGTASRELSRGLVSALGWLQFSKAEPYIQQLLASPSLILQRAGIAASAIHRQNPGSPLSEAVCSTDPLLKARALRAVGELGLESLRSDVDNHLADKDDLCRFAAAWSAALLSDDLKALKVLGSVANSNLPYHEQALQLAFRRMDASAATAWRAKLAVRPAIVASGAFGDPADITWLIEQMKTPEFARVAGEAFTMITGVDIAFEDLDGEKPEGFEAGPTEDPADENVEMDPDEHLPWPDPKLIAHWWERHRGGLETGVRHLLGKPITVDWCQQVLRVGRQRQRAAAALELAIRLPGQPLFNVAAPGFRQQQMLGLRRS